MGTHNGVIEDASGDLLRCGFTNFDLGPGESQRNDCPHPGYVVSDPKESTGEFHRWNGSSWELATDSSYVPPTSWPVATERKIRKLEAKHLSHMQISNLVKSYWMDDLDDTSGIDDALSSGYEHRASDCYVKVASGQPSATVVSERTTSTSKIAAVEVVASFVGSPTFEVSTDDGANWTSATPGEETTVPSSERGKKLRIRANLSPGDEVEYWAAHF